MRLLALLALLGAAFAAVTKLCVPNAGSRAYVTSLTDVNEHLIRVQVLGVSLKKADVSAHLVVMLPEQIAKAKLLSKLNSQGFVTYVVPRAHTKSMTPQEMLDVFPAFAWDLTTFHRVVYIDPYSLVESNPDSLFACDGFCANKRVENGPIVLEPSKEYFSYLREFIASKGGRPKNVIRHLHEFFTIDKCPLFDETEYLGAEGETASMFFMNPAMIAKCQRFERAPLSTCHRLSAGFGVAASNFSPTGVFERLECNTCDRFTDPAVIVFSRQQQPWESFLFVDDPIQWRWFSYRGQLPVAASDIQTMVLWTMLPLVLVAALMSLRKCEVVPLFNNARWYVPTSSLVAAALLGTLWYQAIHYLGRSMNESTWHPTSTVAVMSAWLCLGMTVGLLLVDVCFLWLSASISSVHVALDAAAVVVGTLLVAAAKTAMDEGSAFAFDLRICLVVTAAVLCVRYALLKQALGTVPAPSSPVSAANLMAVLWASLLFCVVGSLLCAYDMKEYLKTVLLRVLIVSHAVLSVAQFVWIFGGRYWLAKADALWKRYRMRAAEVSYSRVPLDDVSPSMAAASGAVQQETIWQALVAGFCAPIHALVVSRQPSPSGSSGSGGERRGSGGASWTLPKGWSSWAWRLGFLALVVAIGVAYVSSIRPALFPYQCLWQKDRYLSPINGFSTTCGYGEALQIQAQSKWSETFSQYKFCLSTGPRPGSKDPNSRGYLTVYRSISDSCDHHSEYVLSPVHGSHARFCIYNTQRGLYLSSKSVPQPSCGKAEHWLLLAEHQGTYIWHHLSRFMLPFKQTLYSQYPLAGFCVLAAAYLVMKSLKGLKSATVVKFFLLLAGCYAVHTVVKFALWGSSLYERTATRNTEAAAELQRELGILSGPDLTRLAVGGSSAGVRCPESLWWLAAATGDLVPLAFFLVLFALSAPRAGPRPVQVYAHSQDAGLYSEHWIDHFLVVPDAVLRRLLLSVGSALVLETALSLAVPFRAVGWSDIGDACAGYEARFSIRGFEHEHVETVLILTYALVNVFMYYGVHPVMKYLGIVFGAVVCTTLWAISDGFYVAFFGTLAVNYFAWNVCVPAMIARFPKLALPAAVNEAGIGGVVEMKHKQTESSHDEAVVHASTSRAALTSLLRSSTGDGLRRTARAAEAADRDDELDGLLDPSAPGNSYEV